MDDDGSDTSRALARERFGGTNVGAAFFGWLVATGMLIILLGIVGAIATAVGASNDISFSQAISDAEAEPDSYGILAGITLLVILMIAYYAGGYVAGRMSRYDGSRQGSAVWLIGVLLTIAASVLGALAGRQYDVLDRVDLPTVSYSTDNLTVAGAIAAFLVLALTLVAAMAGGRTGRHYHDKVDRVAGTLS